MMHHDKRPLGTGRSILTRESRCPRRAEGWRWLVALTLLAGLLSGVARWTPTPVVAAVSEGRVVAWGSQDDGRSDVPPGLTGVIAVADGSGQCLALKSDGTVVGWGNNLGGAATVPPGLTGVTAIAAGNQFSLALKSDGTVVGWGTSTAAAVPSGLIGVTAIAAGNGHALARKSDGTVVAWGRNDVGQATPPAGLTGVTAMAGGLTHSLALKSDGTVVGWGDNSSAQAQPPAGLTGVVAITAESFHSLALKSDGTLVGWGSGFGGGALSFPAGLSGVTAISTGIGHGTALKADGTVVAWGRPPGGKGSVPKGLAGVLAISSGGDHNLAITTLTSSLTVTTVGSGSGTVTPSSGVYPRGTQLPLLATPADGSSFAGWRVDGTIVGDSRQNLTLTIDRDHSVVVAFASGPPPTFTDVPSGDPAASAISILTRQGVIKGYGDGTFGPDDPTLRAQMAALIARAMGWDAEDHANTFPDQCDPPGSFDPAKNCIDPDLWRNVGTMQFYEVAKGFQDGTYAPRNEVLYAQAISFITRAMVKKGYWEYQVDNAAYYPDVTDADHRRDIATYVFYVGALPETSEPTENWPIWADPSTRAWFAMALVQAVNSAFQP